MKEYGFISDGRIEVEGRELIILSYSKTPDVYYRKDDVDKEIARLNLIIEEISRKKYSAINKNGEMKEVPC